MAKRKDEGHEETDEILKEIESEITKEYSQAEKEIEEKLDDYLSAFAEKDEKKRQQVEEGTLDMSEYLTWRTGQIAIGKRWEEMKETISTDLTNASSIAKSISVGYMPEVYSVNYNYGVYMTEKLSCTDTSYTLYSKTSVQKLFDDDTTFYHKAGKKLQGEINTGKTKAWNKKQVQSVMIQSLLQGESIDKIATRLSDTVGEKNRASSIRNARTMTTSIENAGRMDAGKRAEDMGIECKKVWMATLDDRTRHWHRDLDMQKKPMDEPFYNAYGSIRYPADPYAASANIYNCRCTLGYSVDDIDLELSDRYDEKLGDMTYEEWKNGHKSDEDVDLGTSKENEDKDEFIFGKKSDKKTNKTTSTNRKVVETVKEDFDTSKMSDIRWNAITEGLDYVDVSKLDTPFSEKEIIEKIGQKDKSNGSCGSVSLCYVAQKNGYDVTDFRDGESRVFFSHKSTIQAMADFDGVEGYKKTTNGYLKGWSEVKNEVSSNKEYILSTGKHRAIIRKNSSGEYEYLELQRNENGWNTLDDNSLRKRFGVEENDNRIVTTTLIEIDSLGKSEEFIKMLGYINTNDEG